MWKTVTVPDLRGNSEKIKKFYAIEHKHRDLLDQRKGNVSNFVILPSVNRRVSVIHKEIYMPHIGRFKKTFSKADRFYNQGIRKLGGSVVNDKTIGDLVKEKLKNGHNKKS